MCENEQMTQELHEPNSPIKLVRPPWMFEQWMIAGNPALFFDRLVNEFGDYIHYRGLFNFYLVNHPTLVKQVLQETHKSFDKNSVIYDRFRVAIGGGLVAAEGNRWKRQRKLMQPLFGPTTVKRYFSLMQDATANMLASWSDRCQSGTVFDASKDMSHLTLEIAGRAFFHDGFTEASEKIYRWTQAINRYSAKPPLPIIRSSWFPSHVNIGLRRNQRQFHAFLQEIIDARRAAIDATQTQEREDLITILLKARHEDTNEAMTDLEIKEEVVGMIIGGHETSSTTLTWLWYELARHPEIERQLHAEIEQVIGGRELELDDIPNLVYTRMVIEEAMRLHPPAWFENRNVTKDVELGGVTLPAGSLVAFSRYSLHRHKDFWKEPDRFDPERFRPDHEENRRSTYASVPFGGGPRICLGIHFAMLELVAVVAMIAQRFNVIVDATDRHKMVAHLTMTPKYGVKVRLERRS
jgi:cytochrome P450